MAARTPGFAGPNTVSVILPSVFWPIWRAAGGYDCSPRPPRPVYDGFNEGFVTQDLKDAKALLGELG